MTTSQFSIIFYTEGGEMLPRFYGRKGPGKESKYTLGRKILLDVDRAEALMQELVKKDGGDYRSILSSFPGLETKNYISFRLGAFLISEGTKFFEYRISGDYLYKGETNEAKFVDEFSDYKLMVAIFNNSLRRIEREWDKLQGENMTIGEMRRSRYNVAFTFQNELEEKYVDGQKRKKQREKKEENELFLFGSSSGDSGGLPSSGISPTSGLPSSTDGDDLLGPRIY